ncbi:MAG: hypothetical protein MHM6MM_004155 [Cercozoa sp. M6MM]
MASHTAAEHAVSKRLAERLLVLLNVGKGLNVRLYRVLQSSLPAVLDEGVDKVVKHLSKHMDGRDVEKVAGFEIFTSKSSDICDALFETWDTLCAVLDWRQHALDLLSDVNSCTVWLSMDENGELTSRTLTLLAQVVRVYLLLDRTLSLSVTSASCYARAHRLVHGTDPAEYSTLSEFLTAVDDGVVPKLQEDCASFSDRIGEVLCSSTVGAFFNHVVGYGSARYCNFVRPLVLARHPQVAQSLHRPPGHQRLMLLNKLCYLDQMQEWILFGFLACPNVLTEPDPNAKKGFFGRSSARNIDSTQTFAANASMSSLSADTTTMLESSIQTSQAANAEDDGMLTEALPLGVRARRVLATTLSDVWNLRLFREEHLNVHQIYGKLFSSFRKGKARLSKYKDEVLKRAALVAANDSWENHSRIRACLADSVESARMLCADCPGVAGAFLPVMLSLVALSRRELDWMFRHLNESPPRKPRHKFDTSVESVLNRADVDDVAVPSFVTSAGESFAKLLRATLLLQEVPRGLCRSVTRPYMRSLVGKVLRDEVEKRVARLLSEGQVAPSMSLLLKRLVGDLRRLNQAESTERPMSLEALRLNWYRTLAALSFSTYTNMPVSMRDLVRLLNQAIFHSRLYDRADAEFRRHADLSAWAFETEKVAQIAKFSPWEMPLLLTKILASVEQSQVTRAVPQEAEEFALRFMNFAKDTLLPMTAEAIVSKFEIVADCVDKLEHAHSHESFGATLLKKMRNKETSETVEVFGDESVFDARQRPLIQRISAAVQNITTTTHLWVRQSDVQVFYLQINLPSMLHVHVRQWVRMRLRRIGSALDCVDTQRRLENLSQALFAFGDAAGDFGARELLLAVTQSEFAQRGEDSIAARHVAKLVELCSEPLAQHGIVFSRALEAFTWHSLLEESESKAKILSSAQVNSFVTLGGVDAVKLLDGEIKPQVLRRIKQIGDIIRENAGVLRSMEDEALSLASSPTTSLKSESVSSSFETEELQLRSAMSQAQSLLRMDELCECATVLGQLLALRRMAHASLERHVQRRGAPELLARAVAAAERDDWGAGASVIPPQLDDVVLREGLRSRLRKLANMLGKVHSASDVWLRECLREAGITSDWEYLPTLFAANPASASKFWKKARYLGDVRAVSNNGHLLADAFVSISAARHRCVCDDLLEQQKTHRESALAQDAFDLSRQRADEAVCADLRRFATQASYAVLHVMAQQRRQKKSVYRGVSPLCLAVTLEEFFLVSGPERLPLVLLERCFPYTVAL